MKQNTKCTNEINMTSRPMYYRVPVSYTHLDVYKRQVLYMTKSPTLYFIFLLFCS